MESITALIIIFAVFIAGLFAPLWGAVGVILFSSLESLAISAPYGEIRAAYCAAAGFTLAIAIRFYRSRGTIDFGPALLLAAWLTAALISSLLGFAPTASAPTLIKWGLFAGTTLAIVYVIRLTPNPLPTIYSAWVTVIGVTVLLGGAQAFSSQQAFWRPTGGFIDWNYAAIALAMMFPLAWYSSDCARTPFRGKILKGLAIAGLIIGVATRSRSGALIIGIMLATVLLIRYSNWRRFQAITGLALAGSVFLLAAMLIAGGTPSRIMDSPTLHERIGNGLLAFHIFIENPLIGVGAGQFAPYAASIVENSEFTVTERHSSWLTLLAETGLFGGLAIAGLLTLLARNAWRLRDSEEGRALFTSAITLLAAATFYAIHAHLFTWCLIGFLWGRLNEAQYRTTRTQPASSETV